MPRARFLVVAACIAALLLAGCTSDGERSSQSDAAPDPPRSGGAEWIVAMGDSYISGEGARWAANTNGKPRQVDALGPRAYAAKGRREADPGCHRARFSEVQIGDGLKSKTLACSGAMTASTSGDGVFKPGLDFVDDGSGHVGQAAALENFASAHQVSDVVVSIGGNDFGFGPVIAQCAGAFFSTVGRPQQRPCRTDRGSAPDSRGAATAHRDPDHRCVAQCREGDAASRVRE